MRKPILALLLALFVLCMPQVSHAATCTLDEATVGGSDATCPISGTNNFLPSSGFNILRLQPSNILSGTPININNVCRFTDARGITASYAIPINTATEWNSYIANHPSGTTIAQCCIARQMHVSDVPKPPLSTCRNWRLKGLVASTSSTTYLARPADQRADTPITLVQSQIEDPDYPIETLPFERDDIGSVFPAGTKADQTYLARWECTGIQTVAHATGDIGGRTTDINGNTVGVINGEIGDITFTTFKMQCRNANWTTITPDTCVETVTASSQTCVSNDHPSSWTGAVYVLNKKNCPNGNITTTKVYDGCKAPVTCTESTVDTTVPCATGFTGNITRTTRHVCDGSNGGLGGNVVTDNTSQCVAVTCTPGDVGDNFSETCGAGFTGSAVYKYVRSCPTGSTYGVLTKTLVSNTCVCPATTDLGNVTKTCPSGQTGSPIVHQVQTCVQAQPTGTGPNLPSWGICSCSITETAVSGACTGTCVAGEYGDTFTVACPTGQTGVITKRHSQACPSGVITDIEKSNTCTPDACVPGLFGDSFTASCPTGQNGIITKRHSRTCPSGVVSDVETGNTCAAPTCTPGQVGETFPFPCPSNNSGVITKKHVRACPSGLITDEEIGNTCQPLPVCVPGEVSRSAVDCGNLPGAIYTINTRVCDGSNGGLGKIVTTTDNQCGHVTGCLPSRTVTQEACPTGQTGTITVINAHVCHSRHGWDGWETCDNGNGQSTLPVWLRWLDGGERDITIRDNHCVPANACAPSDTTASRACPSGYNGQIIVRTQHFCDGSNNGLGRDVFTETNQCAQTCVAGPTCNPYTSPCPSGQTGVITRQNFRTCPTGDIEIREIGNTCSSSCHPTDPVVTSEQCPSGQTGQITTTRYHTCDGSNNGTGRDVVRTDNQCHSSCTPSRNRTTRACPTGQSGVIEVFTRHICDGSNGGAGSDTTREENHCRGTCQPNISMMIEDCAQGYTGGRTIKTEHVCDGSNNGAGKDVVTTTGQVCHPVACTPSHTESRGTCPVGKIGYVRLIADHVCDGSNGGAGKDVATTDDHCANACIPTSNTVDSACPSGQSGVIHTTTAHICDGSNGGGGRDTVTTDNQCHLSCTPSTNSTSVPCPNGQIGTVTTTTNHVCDGSNGGAGSDHVMSTGLCLPACTPSSNTVDASCPSGQEGHISTTTAHICDGSNGGLGRDTTSTDIQCHAICTPGATCSPYTRACPQGQVGVITLHRVRQCPSGNEVEEVIGNTCHVPVTCTPTSTTIPQACPAGYAGAIYINHSHICDGSNGGAGRDTTSTSDQCTITVVSGDGGGGGDGGGSGSGGDGGSGSGDGGGCGDGGGSGDGGD